MLLHLQHINKHQHSVFFLKSQGKVTCQITFLNGLFNLYNIHSKPLSEFPLIQNSYVDFHVSKVKCNFNTT